MAIAILIMEQKTEIKICKKGDEDGEGEGQRVGKYYMRSAAAVSNRIVEIIFIVI